MSANVQGSGDVAKSKQEAQVTAKALPSTPSKQQQQRASPRSFLLLIIPFCYFLARYALLEHCTSGRWSEEAHDYDKLTLEIHHDHIITSDTLPAPRADLRDPNTKLAHFSEAKALDYVRHYSEEIGYRIVGTPEMDKTIDYTLQVVQSIKDQATNPNIEIEISRQRGDGHHLFEFMGKVSSAMEQGL